MQLSRTGKPTRRRMRQHGTAAVRDNSELTVLGLQDLHANMEKQMVVLKGKIALMDDGPERLEMSVMLLAFANKQEEIAHQIDVMLARKT